jgi:hypothetical protein
MTAEPALRGLSPDVPVLSYGAMRMRWCRWALQAFVKRWAVYLLVAVAVVGAGAVGFVTIIMAAAAWVVLPLFYAASQGLWWLPAVVVQALLGAAAVWGMRQWLWPLSWGDAERALPIARRELQRSDTQVVLIALLPLLLLYAVGGASLLSQNPDWLRPVRVRAGLGLMVAAAFSVLLGVGLLQRQRLPATVRALAVPASAATLPAISRSQSSTRWVGSAHWALALVWWPLWRGPARRTGQWLLVGTLVLLVPALGMSFSPHGVAWWLAALALLAMLVATRINHLAREELQPLLHACSMLPLRLQRVEWLRASLGVWPVLLALGVTAVVLLGQPAWRPVVGAAFAVALLMSVLLEVIAPPATAEDKAARWLFSLVLCVCLATEVML